MLIRFTGAVQIKRVVSPRTHMRTLVTAMLLISISAFTAMAQTTALSLSLLRLNQRRLKRIGNP